jgi:hypothetical protein
VLAGFLDEPSTLAPSASSSVHRGGAPSGDCIALHVAYSNACDDLPNMLARRVPHNFKSSDLEEATCSQYSSKNHGVVCITFHSLSVVTARQKHTPRIVSTHAFSRKLHS